MSSAVRCVAPSARVQATVSGCRAVLPLYAPCRVCACVCSAPTIVWQNFFPDETLVSVGGVPCTGVVVTDAVGLGELRCVAPPGPGFGDVQVLVMVTGTGNASTLFLYTAPAVTSVNYAVCAADVNVVITVSGSNLGPHRDVGNTGNSPDPVVYIGGSVCIRPVLLSPMQLQCTALAAPVGVYPVVGRW